MADLFNRIDNTSPMPARAGGPLRVAAYSNMQRVAEALSGRFEVLRPLAHFEPVEYYQARECRSGATVLLKVLVDAGGLGYMQREMFQMEGRAASRLQHMNILGASGVEESDGIYFCAIENKSQVITLKSLIDQRGWLDLGRAVEYADQIADALDYAHRLGVMHLALQPEKILIEPGGWVLVADFGVDEGDEYAWAHQERSRRCGAQYLSPEQAIGARCDHRSDLYSLGVLLFEMLTDRVPFDSDDAEYIKQRHRTHPPKPPHMFSPTVPVAVSDIVMKMLERNPDKRFDDAAGFQSALNKALKLDLKAANGID